MKQTVELFSGTQSFSNVARKRGYKTFTVEINKNQKANLHKNMLDVEVSDLPKDIDILWASPPCTTFSIANTQHGYKNFIPTTTKAALGLAYVLKTLELIKEIKLSRPGLIWFIENPMGYLRKFPMMTKIHKTHVWYCRYGDFRAKPTDIWNNLYSWIGKRCFNNNKSCHHEAAPRSSKNSGTQKLKGNIERSRIPADLFEELFDVLENKSEIMQQTLK